MSALDAGGGDGVENRIGVDPVGVIEVIDGTGLTETIDPEWVDTLTGDAA